MDVLHVQYTAPPFCAAPVVATIHDLAFEHMPETFTRRGSLQLKLTVQGLYLMAPACRVDLFQEKVLPAYAAGQVSAYTQFHLNDKTEQDDDCAHVYNRSLLYLVSNACERKPKTPILGMEKFVQAANLAKARPRRR